MKKLSLFPKMRQHALEAKARATASDSCPIPLSSASSSSSREHIIQGLLKCCIQCASKFGKLQRWPQDWKMSVFIPSPKKGNAKECSNYRTIALISHASKVMPQILQPRLKQYVNFQMFKLVLEKAEKPEIKLPISAGSSKKQKSSRKTSISALLTMPKPLTVWITINCRKF